MQRYDVLNLDENLIKLCRAEYERRIIAFGKWKALNKKTKY